MRIHIIIVVLRTWDIPHQNWGVEEWDRDFRAMRDMGINTVVLIRAGLGRWIAAPFESILATEDVYYPPVDLVEMFLCLADKCRAAQLASIRQMSRQVSRGSAGEYQADEQAGVARLRWRVSGR